MSLPVDRCVGSAIDAGPAIGAGVVGATVAASSAEAVSPAGSGVGGINGLSDSGCDIAGSASAAMEPVPAISDGGGGAEPDSVVGLIGRCFPKLYQWVPARSGFFGAGIDGGT